MFVSFRSMPLKFRSVRVTIALALAALVLSTAAPMRASINPIPGVDVIVKKNPPGTKPIVATTDRSGRFTARVTEPGKYTVFIVCKTEPCPHFTVSISASGKELKANKDLSYDLTVEDRKPVVLTGQVLGPAEPVKALSEKEKWSIKRAQLVTFNKGNVKLPISEPILPGKRGAQAFALDKARSKLFLVIGESGGSVTLQLVADK